MMSAPPAAVPFSEALADFVRLYEPAAPRGAAAALRAAAAAAGASEATLAALLEARSGAAGFFADPRACFSSRFFDARAALYARGRVPPCPAARPLDNVHKAQALLPRGAQGAAAGAAGGEKGGEGGDGAALAAAVDTDAGAEIDSGADAEAGAGAYAGAGAGADAVRGVVLVRHGVLHSAAVEARDERRRQGAPPPSLLEWLADDALTAARAGAGAAAGAGAGAAAGTGSGADEGADAGAGAGAVASASVGAAELHALFVERARVRVSVRWRDSGGGGGTLTGVLRGLDRARNLLLFDCRWDEGERGDEGGGSEHDAKRPRRGREDGGGGAPLSGAVLLRGEHVLSIERAT